MKIDAHHHFWRYNPDEYDWIDDSMSCIRRDFLPADLEAELRGSGVDGVVSVQARQSIEETTWLLDLAQASPIIVGVVGWAPLCQPASTRECLERWTSTGRLKGLRHVLQGEADPNFMLRKDFNEGIKQLSAYDLSYDILIFEQHLPQSAKLVDLHPGQRFIVDHSAKPRIRDAAIEPWLTDIRELAKRPNVWCKLSGLVTEAHQQTWTESSLLPYMEAVLEAFGPKRLMFGSDWPVCLTRGSYRNWLGIVERLVGKLSTAEQAYFWHQAAKDAYKL